MAQGPTNVNLIATFIHNNPGCRRVDIKRMLHRAAYGENETRRSQLDCKNQYFQRYGSANNVYLDRLWFNEYDGGSSSSYNRYGYAEKRNYTRKSSYQLTWQGKDKIWHRPMRRPFEEGSLVEWQYISPNRHRKRGWHPSHRGLVVERSDLYGLWVLGVGGSATYGPRTPDGQLFYVSHQAFVRRYND